MGGKAPDPPPAPNYTAIANQQGELDKQVAAQMNWANRPNINTPWGGQNWTAGVQTDPSTGQPVTSWTQNTSLDPALQGALTSQIGIQQGLSDLAGGFQERVGETYAEPFDWQNLPESGQIGEAGGGLNRAYEQIQQLRAPQVAERRGGLETQLANQGLTPGSEAYTREMRRLSDEETRGDLTSQLQAGQFADAQQARELNAANYANQLRQQGISEQQLERATPLNEMQAILTGQQVGMPQMPSFQRGASYSAPNMMGAASQQYGAGLDAYNAQAGQYGNMMSGMFGLGGQAIDAAAPFMLSDKRFKHLIARIGTALNKIPVYLFEYLGRSERWVGVLAQDVLPVKPEAVLNDGGVLRVNYGAL